MSSALEIANAMIRSNEIIRNMILNPEEKCPLCLIEYNKVVIYKRKFMIEHLVSKHSVNMTHWNEEGFDMQKSIDVDIKELRSVNESWDTYYYKVSYLFNIKDYGLIMLTIVREDKSRYINECLLFPSNNNKSKFGYKYVFKTVSFYLEFGYFRLQRVDDYITNEGLLLCPMGFLIKNNVCRVHRIQFTLLIR